jgi:hypothetical protein
MVIHEVSELQLFFQNEEIDIIKKIFDKLLEDIYKTKAQNVLGTGKFSIKEINLIEEIINNMKQEQIE